MSAHKLAKYFFLLFLFVPTSRAQTNEQQIKVVLRTIGHEFLLELGDSSSLVLPIEKNKGRYAVKFEQEFAFMPDVLQMVTFNILEESRLSNSFIVEVEKCRQNEIIYSFKVGLNKEENMLPCQGRELPKDCYVFFFTVVENTEPLQNTVTVDEQNTEASNQESIFTILILLGGAVLMFYLYKKKKRKKVNQDVIDIGRFQFDQKGMTLKMKAQSIELSSKEADLLYLLYQNENKTLEREYILKVVWGDDGDYVGRTLDVFISKLRKKLEADASLKIVNIRGIGYRFVMN